MTIVRKQTRLAFSLVIIVTTLLLSLLFSGYIPGPVGRALSNAAGGWVIEAAQ